MVIPISPPLTLHRTPLLISFHFVPALYYLEMRLASIRRKKYIKTFQFSTNNKKTQSMLGVRKKASFSSYKEGGDPQGPQ
jgi:hypothetical protein